MDETEIIKLLGELGAAQVGIVGMACYVIWIIYKKLNVGMKILNAMHEEKVFESFNENLRFINESITTYKFKGAIFKKDSQEIFTVMKRIYDMTANINIDIRVIHFKMHELSDDSVTYSNIVRFLDYYKSKNGVKILIHLYQPHFAKDETKKGIHADLIKYITSSDIHGAKIINDKQPDRRIKDRHLE